MSQNSNEFEEDWIDSEIFAGTRVDESLHNSIQDTTNEDTEGVKTSSE